MTTSQRGWRPAARRTTVYLPGEIYELALEMDLNLSALVRQGILAEAKRRGRTGS